MGFSSQLIHWRIKSCLVCVCVWVWVCVWVVCEWVVCVSVCVGELCVWVCVGELCAGRRREDAAGGGGRRMVEGRRAEVRNQKQEPHTMMGGKNGSISQSGSSRFTQCMSWVLHCELMFVLLFKLLGTTWRSDVFSQQFNTYIYMLRLTLVIRLYFEFVHRWGATVLTVSSRFASCLFFPLGSYPTLCLKRSLPYAWPVFLWKLWLLNFKDF